MTAVTGEITGLVEAVLTAIFGVSAPKQPPWMDGDQTDVPNAEDSDGVDYAVTPQFSDVPLELTLTNVVPVVPKAAAAWSGRTEQVAAGKAQRIAMANPLRRRLTITNYGNAGSPLSWIAIGTDESTTFRSTGNTGGYILVADPTNRLFSSQVIETTADVFAVLDDAAAAFPAAVGVLEELDDGGTVP
jgi:hypothetical protein